MSDQSVKSIFSSNEQHDLQNIRENPEEASSIRHLLIELEKVLNMEEKGMKLSCINSRGQVQVSNRAVYKIYKAVLMEKNVEPNIIYTGRSTKNIEDVKEIVENTDKEVEDLEVTI